MSKGGLHGRSRVSTFVRFGANGAGLWRHKHRKASKRANERVSGRTNERERVGEQQRTKEGDSTALPPPHHTEMIVYHERQEAGLCGVHCLNALLQGPVYSEVDLMGIAAELDRREAALMSQAGLDDPGFLRFVARDSANVSDDGNFSVQVIEHALAAHGLHCVPLGCTTTGRCGDGDGDGDVCEGYVCNHAAHWFCLRHMHGLWLNLNSLLRRPAVISDTHLELFLAQLQAEGYSVFRVLGRLPEPLRTEEFPTGRTMHGRWLALDFVLHDQRRSHASAHGEAVVPVFRELAATPSDDSSDDTAGNKKQRPATSTTRPGGQHSGGHPSTEDEQITAAIAASLADVSQPRPPQTQQQQRTATAPHTKTSSATTAAEDIELAIALSLSEQQQQQQQQQQRHPFH